MLLQDMPQIVVDYSSHHRSHSYPLEGIAISSVCNAVNPHIHVTNVQPAMQHATDATVKGTIVHSVTVFAASQAFQQDSIISEEPVANPYLDAIGTSQESSWSVKLHVDSQKVIFEIDTGAEVTAILPRS